MEAQFDLDQKVGNQVRPSFKQGEVFKPIVSPIKPSFPVSIRNKDLRGRLRRPNFRLTAPQPKHFKSIDQIEALKVKQEGIKIRLSDKQLGTVKVPKRDGDGNIIKDSSGNVIMEEKNVDFGTLTQILTGALDTRFEALTALVTDVREKAGRHDAVAVRERATLAAGMMGILGKVESIERLTSQQLQFITQSLALLGIARDPVAAGLQGLVDDRFITRSVWDADDGSIRGAIVMFLLANIEFPMTASRPILGLSGNPIAIQSLFVNMSGQATRRVLDLVGKRIHPGLADAKSFVGLRPGAPEVVLEEEEEEGRFNILTPIQPVVRGDDLMAQLARQLQQQQRAEEGALVPFQEGVAQPTTQQPQHTLTLESLQNMIAAQQGQPGFRLFGQSLPEGEQGGVGLNLPGTGLLLAGQRLIPHGRRGIVV